MNEITEDILSACCGFMTATSMSCGLGTLPASTAPLPGSCAGLSNQAKQLSMLACSMMLRLTLY